MGGGAAAPWPSGELTRLEAGPGWCQEWGWARGLLVSTRCAHGHPPPGARAVGQGICRPSGFPERTSA